MNSSCPAFPRLHHQNKNGHCTFVQMGKRAWLSRDEGCLKGSEEGFIFSGCRSGLSKTSSLDGEGARLEAEHARGRPLHGFHGHWLAVESHSRFTETSCLPSALIWRGLTIRYLRSEDAAYVDGQKQLSSLWRVRNMMQPQPHGPPGFSLSQNTQEHCLAAGSQMDPSKSP